jgi:hypothetical protein
VCNGKDVLVCVQIRNILGARGCFRNVKVPSSPYKRGREDTCKRIHNFGTCAATRRFSISSRLNAVFERVKSFHSLPC